IRVSKNLKQEAIYGNLISRNHLWQIENDKINTSYDIFKEILVRLNVSNEEFFYIQNDYKITPLQALQNRYSHIYTSIEIDILTDLKKDIEIYLEYNPKNPLLIDLKKCLIAIIEIEVNDDYNKASQIVHPIWERISEQNDWYWEDIQIMSHIFYMFNKETALNICKELFQKLNNYREFQNADRLEISTLLNISSLLIEKNSYLEAEPYIKKCITLAEERKYFIQWAYAIGIQGIIESKKENIEEGLQLLNKGKTILKTINEELLANTLQSDYNKYILQKNSN
ncbi:TPA: hypothetical protein ACSKR0_002900, partial [Listeria monocytogenes]